MFLREGSVCERRGEEAASHGADERTPVHYQALTWPPRLGGTWRGGQQRPYYSRVTGGSYPRHRLGYSVADGPVPVGRRAGPPAADVPVPDALDAGPAHPSLYLGDLVGARAHRRQDRRPFGRADVLGQRLAIGVEACHQRAQLRRVPLEELRQDELAPQVRCVAMTVVRLVPPACKAESGHRR